MKTLAIAKAGGTTLMPAAVESHVVAVKVHGIVGVAH